MSATINPVPPGWYPDPGGSRSWRVWNGHDWTAVTRPFGDPATAAGSLVALPVLHRLARVGVVAFFAGLGLLVSALAHWPGTASPTPQWFALLASELATALLVFSSVLYALSARSLGGRLVLAAVPVLNVFYLSVLVESRLRGPVVARRRVPGQVVLIVLFIVASHVQPWLAVAPAFVAFEQARNLGELQERLSGSLGDGRSMTTDEPEEL